MWCLNYQIRSDKLLTVSVIRMKERFLNKFFGDNDKNSVRLLLGQMIIVMAVISLVFYLLSLCWGFDLKMLLGFAVGYVYVCLCYVYVARTVENAVGMSKQKAKRSVITCYVIRYAGLFLLCFLAMQFKCFNVVGVVIPQFYPRMAVGIISYFERKNVK